MTKAITQTFALSETSTISFAPAVITADMDAIKAHINSLIEPYQDMTDEALTSMPERELKAARADIRKIIKNAEDARKAVKAVYTEPLKQFEADIKDILVPAHDAEDQIASVCTKRENARKEAKRQEIENIYLEYANILAEQVPLDRILETSWLNKTTSITRIEKELTDKVNKIAKDWESLQSNQESMPFYDEAEAVFFETLSLSEAINTNAKRVEEQKKLEEFRAKVDENKRAQFDSFSLSDAAGEDEQLYEEVPAQEAYPEVYRAEPSGTIARIPYIIRIDLTEREKEYLMSFVANNNIGANRILGTYQGFITDVKKGLI